MVGPEALCEAKRLERLTVFQSDHLPFDEKGWTKDLLKDIVPMDCTIHMFPEDENRSTPARTAYCGADMRLGCGEDEADSDTHEDRS